MQSHDKKLTHPVFGNYSVFMKFFGGTFYTGPLMLQQDKRPLMVSPIQFFWLALSCAEICDLY